MRALPWRTRVAPTSDFRKEADYTGDREGTQQRAEKNEKLELEGQ